MSELYREMSANERLRRELEEEKRRLFERPVSRSPTPPPTSTSSSTSSAYVDSRVRAEAAALGYSGQSQVPREPGPDHDQLKPGNYLLAAWDCMRLTGSSSSPEDSSSSSSGAIVQLGCFLPHGVEFQASVWPEGEEDGEGATEEELSKSGHFVHLGGRWLGAAASARHEVISTRAAITGLLDFLEKGCRSVRPFFDGVLLLSHEQEDIPALIKAAKRLKVYDRFRRTVRGVGDLCTYLAQCHAKRLSEGGAADSQGRIDFGLSSVARAVLGEAVSSRSPCQRRAQVVHGSLERLLGGAKPGYQNFFSRFLHPLDSRLVQGLISFRTVREREEECLPLRVFVARELAARREEEGVLVAEGVYAPSAEDELRHPARPEEQVAAAVCRLLVGADLDLPRLQRVFRERGLDGLELALRTNFLRRMAGQPRPVVDQTITATRLVVSFFRQNGHKSLEEMGREIREEKRRERRREERERMRASFDPLHSYLGKRFSENPLRDLVLPGKSTAEVGDFVDRLVSVLVEANLDLDNLASVYERHRKNSLDQNDLRLGLHLSIYKQYEQLGPREFTVNQFIDALMDFCGSHVNVPSENKNRRSTSPGGGNNSPEFLPASASGLEAASSNLDRAVSQLPEEQHRTFYRHLSTLERVQSGVARALEPGVAMSGEGPEDARRLGEHVGRVLALSGVSGDQLRYSFFSRGGRPELKDRLAAVFHSRAELIPPGVQPEVLVESVIAYLMSVATGRPFKM